MRRCQNGETNLRLPLRLLHHFRCHPAGRAYEGVSRHGLIPPRATPLHSSGHTEVCQQHLTCAVYEDVAGLQGRAMQSESLLLQKILQGITHEPCKQSAPGQGKSPYKQVLVKRLSNVLRGLLLGLHEFGERVTKGAPSHLDGLLLAGACIPLL